MGLGAGLGGGGAVDPGLALIQGQTYLNVRPNLNVLAGLPRDQVYKYPPQYYDALQFQEHYEKCFDTPDAVSNRTPMENFRLRFHTEDPLDHMAYTNVAFIMTVFEWAGLDAKNGVLYDGAGDVLWDVLEEPMSSVHMGIYSQHLKNLYSCAKVPPSLAGVIASCPENILLCDGDDFCNASVLLLVTDATKNHGYTYQHAVMTLFHSAAFGPCLFRFNVARCVQRT